MTTYTAYIAFSQSGFEDGEYTFDSDLDFNNALVSFVEDSLGLDMEDVVNYYEVTF